MTGFHWLPGDEDKFDARVRKTEHHWIWTGHVNKQDGYGRFKPRHAVQPELAHVLAYERWIGPVPDGMVVDHVGHPFRLRRCVRPQCLEAISHPENTRRGSSPAGINSRKTHCATCGLPLAGDNLHVDQPTGWRVCLNCRRRRHREAKQRLRARRAQAAAEAR